MKTQSQLERAFLQCGMKPKYGGDAEFLEVAVRLGENYYYGYSSINKEYALMDLLVDLPEHVALGVQKKAGILS